MLGTDHHPSGRWFADQLDPASSRAIQALGDAIQFDRHEPLMRTGEPATYALVITAGHVKVAGTTRPGTEVIVDFGWPGDLYGDIGVLARTPRMADVVALDHVTAQAIDAHAFRQFVSRSPDARHALMATTMRRLTHANRHRMAYRHGDALQRVARCLLNLADLGTVPEDDGMAIDLPISKHELAHYVPASTSAVDDALHQLRERHIITTPRRLTTIITDPDALRHLATTSKST